VTPQREAQPKIGETAMDLLRSRFNDNKKPKATWARAGHGPEIILPPAINACFTSGRHSLKCEFNFCRGRRRREALSFTHHRHSLADLNQGAAHPRSPRRNRSDEYAALKHNVTAQADASAIDFMLGAINQFNVDVFKVFRRCVVNDWRGIGAARRERGEQETSRDAGAPAF
jgi:hypothetical protein